MSCSVTGVPITRGVVLVSHFLFVDDCLLFIKASSLERRRLQDIIHCYREHLDRSRDKTSVHFRKNIPREVRHTITEFLGFVQLVVWRNILVYHRWSVGTECFLSKEKSTKYGRNLIAGKQSFYPKLVRKFYLSCCPSSSNLLNGNISTA